MRAVPGSGVAPIPSRSGAWPRPTSSAPSSDAWRTSSATWQSCQTPMGPPHIWRPLFKFLDHIFTYSGLSSWIPVIYWFNLSSSTADVICNWSLLSIPLLPLWEISYNSLPPPNKFSFWTCWWPLDDCWIAPSVQDHFWLGRLGFLMLWGKCLWYKYFTLWKS